MNNKAVKIIVLLFVTDLGLAATVRDICKKGNSKDIDHPEPGTGCFLQEEKSSYSKSLESYRKNPPPKRDDSEYHDAKELSPTLSRISEEELTASYWNNKAQDELNFALDKQNLNRNVAKNSIIFLGDGMGIQTVTAGRIHKGQLNGHSGEETRLAMDELPHVGFAKTYNVDYQVPDSAGTATAYLTGVKGRYSTIGVNAGTVYGSCSTVEGNEVRSVLKDAKLAGKSTGIVTTTYLVHATPAGAYAHTPNRGWYCDADLPLSASTYGCKDIAHQFYDNLPLIDVALGGGRRYFRPNTVEDETGTTYLREDGQDFVKMWQATTEMNGERAQYVTNKAQLDDVDPNQIDHLWGMFSSGSMDYDVQRDPNQEPSIEEMTRKAIEILQKNENGFYLLVEGARIDHGHHASRAIRALGDLAAMDDAVAAAREMTSEEDTLIVVTADHSHTFNMGEYGVRGNPILGLAPSNEDPEIALDGKPYTSLAYGNGPGYQGSDANYINVVRERLTPEMVADVDYRQQSAVPLGSETHGGEDVPIMASGPMAHLFHTVHEQNYVAHAMRYAACIGDNKDHCIGREEEKTTTIAPKTETIEFLGDQLTSEEATAILNAFFSLEIILSTFIVGLLGFMIKKKRI